MKGSLPNYTKRSLLSRSWWLIAKALGDKAHYHDRVADQVAAIRFIILSTYMLTNIFICAGVLRHWND